MTTNGKGPGYASPQEAMTAEREKLLYTVALYVGTGVEKPDYLATVDVDPASATYSQVVARTRMPQIGDELHHSGWNACSSCHGHADMRRDYLLMPGVRTSNINVIDVSDPREPRHHLTVSGDEIKAKTNLSAPHTVHCLHSDIIVSMLGDAEGNGPGGFLHLDQDFQIVGRWENDLGSMKYNYDFWYQPRHDLMVSSEWAAPNTFMPGFDLEDVSAGKYGQQVHFWNFKDRSIAKSVDLGEEGLIPLEVRGLHDPASSHGYFAATLSSNVFHWWKDDSGEVQLEKVIDVPSVDVESFPVPMPSLITDILISMDDRYLYFANWLHGDLRQYDITDRSNPRLAGQVWLGGLLGKAPQVNGVSVQGAPQMIQLSLDGRRLYVTTSLFSTWDNQFYPTMKDRGGQMFMIDCNIEDGGLSINPDFVVDFGQEPDGPSRAHEMRYPGGDVTSDIWM